MLYECIECSNCKPCYLDDHEPPHDKGNMNTTSSTPTRCSFAAMKEVTWRLLTETEELEYIKDKWGKYFKNNPFIEIEDFNIT